MMIAIIEETTDETVRTAVMGELVFNRFLNSYFGFARFPPDLKYIMMTIIEEITHARLNEIAVLFVAEIFINVVLNKTTRRIILATCSINSVMLIVKNFCCPHRAPRKTS